MIPVVVATNGLGLPVRPVEKNAPSMSVASNGLGIPIVISDLGAPFIVFGLTPDNGLSGTTWPDAPQSEPANLIPAAASEFDTADGWAVADGLTIDPVAGVAHWDGSNVATSVSGIDLLQTATIGDQYGVLASVPSYTNGTLFTGFQFPNTATDGAGFTTFGNYSRQLTATGAYTRARMYVNAGAILDVDYLRAYDISALLEKKWRIVFVYSQSNWVGPGDAADRVANDPPEARAVVIPSSEQLTRGAVLDAEGIGVPMLMCDPVVHLSGNVGGGPAGAFAREFCDGLRDDEVLVYVAAGYAGGGRLMPGDVWNRESDGVAWLNLLKQVDAMVARAPEGSSVAGCLFCQGEADLAENVGDLHAETIRGDFELLRARYGEFPIVVNEIGWEDTLRADVANMIASHAKLDSDSGDPLSLPLCRYVPRPAGSTFLPDTLHYDQPTQRTRGALAATALLQLQYGGPKAALTVTGGTISTFSREGVDYTQILWRESGGFTLSDSVTLQGALVGGGASGGRFNNNGAGMGGGGAGESVDLSGPTPAGDFTITIGAGGAAQAAAAPGNAGSNSVVSFEGSPVLTAQGGGAGGGPGFADGGTGACGGGGGGSGIGGIGTISSGGAADTAGGGGGGAGGDGLNGVIAVQAGNGGPGTTLLFTEPTMDICGGGGGSGYNAAIPGTATHGGTAGAAGTSSANATNGGGSGAATQGTAGAGGDGFCVIVVRSDEVRVS